MNIALKKLLKLKVLWNSIKPNRRRQIVGLQILSLAAASAEVVNIGALLPVLQLIANPLQNLNTLGPLAVPLRVLPEKHLLLYLGIGFLVVVAVSTALRVITILTQMRLAALIASDIAESVFASVLYRPFTWHLEQNSSIVLGYLTKDVDMFNASINSFLALVVNFATVVLLGGALIAYAPGLMAVICILLGVFYILVFRFTRGELRVYGQRRTSSYQSSLQCAAEGLGGIRDVLLDRSQRYFIDIFRHRNRDYRLAVANITSVQQVPRVVIEGFTVILILGLALILALNGKSIEQQLPLLGALSLGAYRLLQPLQKCFAAVSGLQSNLPSLEKLKPFLGTSKSKSHIKSLELTSKSHATGHHFINLVDIDFSYNVDAPLVLDKINLKIRSGERIAFVGTTGSGKSTMSDLILGLLKPTRGNLLINGENLHSTHGFIEHWHDRVAQVPQAIYLSDSDFYSNIAFGVSPNEIDKQRVYWAAEQARIDELIHRNPMGYSTIVGERGVKLSGGQRQRIGLARALYKCAELLVLDEATSALDNRTETEVMDAIDNLDRQMTIIMIAHRLSTVQQCDNIVLLENGKIVGTGTFSDLLATNDKFQTLALKDNLS